MTRVLAFAVLLLTLSPAHALTIVRDHGGNLGQYADRFAAIAARGEQVRVVGVCNSACTLVLGLPNVCAGPRARFGFHRAYRVSSETDFSYAGDSPEGTNYLLYHYPARVKAWLAAHGGLTRRVKVASGAALGLPRCR